MRIYNVPSLRNDSELDLSSLVAPFTELHFHSGIAALTTRVAGAALFGWSRCCFLVQAPAPTPTPTLL